MSIPLGVIASQPTGQLTNPPVNLSHGTGTRAITWTGAGLLVAFSDQSFGPPTDDAGLTWTSRGANLYTAPAAASGSANINPDGANFFITIDFYPGGSFVNAWAAGSLSGNVMTATVSGASSAHPLGYYGWIAASAGTPTGVSLPADKTATLAAFTGTDVGEPSAAASGYGYPASNGSKAFGGTGTGLTLDRGAAIVIEVSGLT